MKLGDIAAAVGKGLFAGAAGTAVMTASSTLEAKLRGRGASTTPAQAASKALGVEPKDEASGHVSITLFTGATEPRGEALEGSSLRQGFRDRPPPRLTSGRSGVLSR